MKKQKPTKVLLGLFLQKFDTFLIYNPKLSESFDFNGEIMRNHWKTHCSFHPSNSNHFMTF